MLEEEIIAANSVTLAIKSKPEDVKDQIWGEKILKV